MKITMLVGLSGPDFNLSPGDSHEPDEAEALRLIAAGFAEPFRPTTTARPPAPEQAVAGPAAEAAVKKSAATTRRKG